MKTRIAAIAMSAALTACSGGGSESIPGLGLNQLPSTGSSKLCSHDFYQGIFGAYGGDVYNEETGDVTYFELVISESSGPGDSIVCHMTADFQVGPEYSAGSFHTLVDRDFSSIGPFDYVPYPVGAIISFYSNDHDLGRYNMEITGYGQIQLSQRHDRHDSVTFFKQ